MATEPTPHLVETKQQNGYGAHKRGEHCSVCYPTTGKVGTWKLTYSDGSTVFYCDDDVPVIHDASPAPSPLAG